MSPFFLALLLMVAAFLLLSLAAVARTIWLSLRPAGAARLRARQSQGYSNVADSLLLLAVAMSWYSVAAGWAGQLVCYPIYADMSAYGSQAFHAYSQGYLSRWAAGGWPVGVMCLTWGILLWVPLRNVPKRLVWSIVTLCVGFAAVTPFAAIAQDHMFAEGFSNDQYARLMLSNGVRTAIFTSIGFLALVAARRRLMFKVEGGDTPSYPNDLHKYVSDAMISLEDSRS